MASIGRQRGQTLLARALFSGDRSGGLRALGWQGLPGPGDDGKTTSGETSDQPSTFRLVSSPSLCPASPVLLTRRTRPCAGLVLHNLGPQATSPFGLNCSHQQLRGLSWQRFVPSMDNLGNVFQSPNRQVTNLLIAINIATYVMTLADKKVAFSMAGIPYLIARGEWYRLLTSGFLHTQILHLAVNMYFLHGMGPALEAAAGRGRFALIFLLSVLGGSWAQYQFGSGASMFLGSSGGGFGILAAYLVYRLRNRAFISWGPEDTSWVAQMAGLNLLAAFMSSGLAHWSHLGGLATGAAVCWLVGPRYRWQAGGGGLVDVPVLPLLRGRR